VRRLPPLNALRTFEAVGRHLSFVRAAEELHVTASAVSHQVRGLEESLGVVLLRRMTRRVALTRAGRDYLPALTRALDEMDDATRRLEHRRAETVVNLSASPTFASEWLIPRLLGFQERFPETDVRLVTALGPPDFDASDVDFAICFGTGHWPGLRVHQLTREELIVVCSPALRAGPPPLRRPQDLRGRTLVHVLPRAGQWASWLAAASVTGIDTERGSTFHTTTLALEAAESGLGIAIADRRLAAPHLASGRLVVPFDLDQRTEGGYHLLYPEERKLVAHTAAFRDWLLDETARELERGPAVPTGVA
jgi:LysR family glycine cleavage system transcriptional activator